MQIDNFQMETSNGTECHFTPIAIYIYAFFFCICITIQLHATYKPVELPTKLNL